VTTQQGELRDLRFGVEDLIAHISSFTPLEEGDVIAVGTPPANSPRCLLQAGDIVEVAVSGVGKLVNRVENEPMDSSSAAGGLRKCSDEGC
jgi:2-keto-4-pentenoate hydratase/2-oxohepta-3-ene-1,7-dioic acid hydratase in catechol pathway